MQNTMHRLLIIGVNTVTDMMQLNQIQFTQLAVGTVVIQITLMLCPMNKHYHGYMCNKIMIICINYKVLRSTTAIIFNF